MMWNGENMMINLTRNGMHQLLLLSTGKDSPATSTTHFNNYHSHASIYKVLLSIPPTAQVK
jgi:hypothetical protein